MLARSAAQRSVALFDADRRIYSRFPPPPETKDGDVLRFEAPELKNALASGKGDPG
jgi:hypothetical protein